MGWKRHKIGGNLLGRGKIKMFVYDVIARYKRDKQEL